MKNNKTVPDIKVPLWRYVYDSIHNPISLRAKIFEKYGDIAKKRAKGKTTYYMAHPKFAQCVLLDHQDKYLYRHPSLINTISPFFGKNGLIVNNNLAQWYKDRLIAKLSFESELFFKDYSASIVAHTDKTLNEWNTKYNDNEVIPINYEIDKLLVSIVVNTFFFHFDLFNVEQFVTLVPPAIELIKNKLLYVISPLWLLSPSRKKYNEAVALLRQITTEVVRERIASNKEWDDLLGNLIHGYKDLSKEELIQSLGYHVATFLLVGYFTTGSLIHWLIVMLSLHPEVEYNICQELDRVVGNRLPRYEDLSSLPYLAAAVKETLRLHPSNYAIMRQCIEHDEIDGYPIQKGAGVILSISHIHRHQDFWVNPEGFDPLRFMDNPLGQEHRFAYVPFGAGKRSCIASAFASMEAMLVISMILQRFRLQLLPHTEIKPLVTSPLTNRPNVNKMFLKKV